MAMNVQTISADGWYAKVRERYVKVLYWLFGVDLETTPPTYLYRGVIWHPKRLEFVSAQSLGGFAGFFPEAHVKRVNLDNLEQWLVDQGAAFASADIKRWKNDKIKRHVLSVYGPKEAENLGLIETEEIEDEP